MDAIQTGLHNLMTPDSYLQLTTYHLNACGEKKIMKKLCYRLNKYKVLFNFVSFQFFFSMKTPLIQWNFWTPYKPAFIYIYIYIYMYIFKRLFFVQPPLKSINAERMNGSTKLYWRYYQIKKKKRNKGRWIVG